jgi:hypothetical protein
MPFVPPNTQWSELLPPRWASLEGTAVHSLSVSCLPMRHGPDWPCVSPPPSPPLATGPHRRRCRPPKPLSESEHRGSSTAEPPCSQLFSLVRFFGHHLAWRIGLAPRCSPCPPSPSSRSRSPPMPALPRRPCQQVWAGLGWLRPCGWPGMAGLFQPWAMGEGRLPCRWAMASGWKRAQYYATLFQFPNLIIGFKFQKFL